MKTFVINLDKDKERLVAADAQLKRLGVNYERVSAVYGKDLSQKERYEAVNHFRWWCAVGRPCRPGEIGCALSHYSIYERLAKNGGDAPVCILEDDVILDARFRDVLNYVGGNIDCGRSQVILLSNHCRENSSPELHCSQGEQRIDKCRSDMFAEGYVITPLAAAALLKSNLPLQCPCDWWGRWARRGIIELYHASPTVCSQDQSQYESGTVGADIFRVRELPMVRFVLHKMKRLVGKTIDNMMPL